MTRHGIPDFFGLPRLDGEWVIVGKGPSFSRWGGRRAGQKVFCLNHTVREVPFPDIAHFIDYEALEDCRDELPFAQLVVVPFHMHVDCRVQKRSILDILNSDEATPLVDLAHSGRLAWYNCSTAKRYGFHASSPVVRVRYFSAEAAVRLLAMAGVKRIKTVGLDGGVEYAQEFSGLTPLENGRKSFDEQFNEIKRTVDEFGIDYSEA